MGLEFRQEAITGDTCLGERISEALGKNGHRGTENRIRSRRGSRNSSLRSPSVFFFIPKITPQLTTASNLVLF